MDSDEEDGLVKLDPDQQEEILWNEDDEEDDRATMEDIRNLHLFPPDEDEEVVE